MTACFVFQNLWLQHFFNKSLWDTLAKICCLLPLEEYQCSSSMQPTVLSLFSDIVWWQYSAIYCGFPSNFSHFGTASLEIWPSYGSQCEDAITRDSVGKTCTAEHHASVEPSFGVVVTPPAHMSLPTLETSCHLPESHLQMDCWGGKNDISISWPRCSRTSHGSRVEGVGFVMGIHLPYCPGRRYYRTAISANSDA